jgi:hypothetical protein
MTANCRRSCTDRRCRWRSSTDLLLRDALRIVAEPRNVKQLVVIDASGGLESRVTLSYRALQRRFSVALVLHSVVTMQTAPQGGVGFVIIPQ